MHSFDFPDRSGTFLFNSDFSGDVLISVRDTQDRFEYTEHDGRSQRPGVLRIPGDALEAFLARMIEYKLGDVGEIIADAVMEKLRGELPELVDEERYFCKQCGCPTVIKEMDSDHATVYTENVCKNCGLVSETGEPA